MDGIKQPGYGSYTVAADKNIQARIPGDLFETKGGVDVVTQYREILCASTKVWVRNRTW